MDIIDHNHILWRGCRAIERSLTMTLRYWWDDGEIKIAGIDHKGRIMWTSVVDRPESKRHHENLYIKLHQRLKEEGKLPDSERP